MQLPHRKLAKNHPGRVKTGRQMQTIDTNRCSCLPNPSNGPINEVEGRRGGLRRQEGCFAGPIVQLPHRKLAKNHPGRVKTGRQTQTIDTNRCSCLPNPSNGPINEVEGRRGGLRRQEGCFAGPIVQLPHRKLAKNHPGRVKTGRQTQTIDTNRCSCLPNPSNGPINEVEGRRGGLRRQEGCFAGPIVQLPHRKLAKNHPGRVKTGRQTQTIDTDPLLMPSQSLQWAHK